MSAIALEAERLELLPPRLETQRWRAGILVRGSNFAWITQNNWAIQSMPSCVAYCYQNLTQINIIYIIQSGR